MLQHLDMAKCYLDAALATIMVDIRTGWIAKAQKAHDKVATWLDVGELRRADVVEALEELRQRLPR